MNSNKLFNALFLIFSFAVIVVASGNVNLTNSTLSNIDATINENKVVYEQEFALHNNMSKAVYQHKI